MLFEELPSDVLILICSWLDINALLRLSECSRTLHDEIHRNQEAIYEAIALALGYGIPQTAGDSGLVGRRCMKAAIDSRTQVKREERPATTLLQRLVNAQTSARGVYDHVTSFYELVRLRYCTQANFFRGVSIREEKLNFPDGIWRFKMCHGFCVGSSPVGGKLRAVRFEESEHFWEARDVDPWTHIEMSEGYMVHHDHEVDRLKVWKLDSTGDQLFRPDKYLVTTHPAFCLKLRYPCLATGNYTAENELVICLHNVETGEMESSFPAPDVVELRYIEHDSKHVFLAGHSGIYIYSKTTGELVGSIPSYSNLNDNQPTFRFTAIHLDEKRDILVALAAGYVIVCNAYSKAMTSAEELYQHMVIGRIRGTLGELSVENGRAVMSLMAGRLLPYCEATHVGVQKTVLNGTEQEQIQSLLLFHIPQDCKLIDNLPVVQIIKALIPTDTPVSRIEQDGTHIYVTAQSDEAVASNECLAQTEALLTTAYCTETLGYWLDADTSFLAQMRLRHRTNTTIPDSHLDWPFRNLRFPNTAVLAISFTADHVSREQVQETVV